MDKTINGSTRALIPSLQARQQAVLYKRRELPTRGEILFNKGQQVEAGQVVARAVMPGDLYIIRLAERMGIEPFEVINNLKVRAGDHVKEGDLLCEHSGLFGLFKTRQRSDIEGTVELVTERTGHIGIRTGSREVEVLAYVSGTVSEVEQGKSLVIEAKGAWMQGIFGVGGEKMGHIRLLEIASNRIIEQSDIPDDIKGAILVGGMRPSLEALHKAGAAGAVGMITASIDDRTLASYLGFDIGVAITGEERVPLSLIVLEGFGDLPFSPKASKFFERLNGKAASINGATQVRAGAIRPEIIVSQFSKELARDFEEVSQMSGLEVGSTVRVIRVPYFGRLAEVVELPQEAQKIDTGAFARVLRARLDSGEVVTIPRANVEAV